jgi:hypothetical protein
MSREGAACRARAQSRHIEDAIGNGTGIELMGYRLIVLFADAPGRAHAPHAAAPPPEVTQAKAAPEQAIPD